MMTSWRTWVGSSGNEWSCSQRPIASEPSTITLQRWKRRSRRGHQQVLHGPVDDGVVVGDQFALGGHGATELSQPFAVRGGDALALDAERRPLRRLLDRQHVHQVVSQRDESRRAGGPDEHPDLVQALDPRQVVAPAHLPGAGGLAPGAEHGLANLRVDAVGAHEQVIVAHLPVGEVTFTPSSPSSIVVKVTPVRTSARETSVPLKDAMQAGARDPVARR
jgi:hypothetical protein